MADKTERKCDTCAFCSERGDTNKKVCTLAKVILLDNKACNKYEVRNER